MVTKRVHQRTSMTIPSSWCRRCGRHHRSWRTAARCRWPKAIWVAGDGPVGLLAAWGGELTITLWSKIDAKAEQAKRQIDKFGCGSGCVGAAGHRFATVLGGSA